tara:strand:+ start:105 stop:374 length:270 start_codon:yes stop_codon:yes gene_type:complete
MAIFGIICLILLVGAGVLIYLQKTGKIGDRDKDLIPDIVEDTIKEAKKTVKSVKKELKEAKSSIKLAAKEIKDVAKAVTGKKRGRKIKK